MVERAILASAQDFAVTDGVRTAAQQAALVDAGRSLTMKSRHLVQPDGYGHAVDLVPFIDGEVSWASWPAFHAIAAVVGESCRALDLAVTWGGAWVDVRTITSADDARQAIADYVAARKRAGRSAFVDGPHYELSP
jgi:peptidoglycan L-alanyl-D-glutamate endopeptidase CwlK